MSSARIVFLMYHELELAGRKLCQSEPGYVRYILPVDTFRTQMAWLKNSGWQGLNVSEALRSPEGQSVCITFDDGSETDLITAAPILHELGFRATSYVTAGFIGTPGYMTASQVRDLDSTSVEIGCHSMTHPYLSDLPDAELKREVTDAKVRIEDIVGHRIDHFSCPGGRYDQRTLRAAREAGFVSVANSRFYANTASTNSYELARVAILRDTTLPDFGAVCRGEGLWRKRLALGARQSIQKLLGNRTYDRLRGLLLKRSP
jgi:peptidoglycan/xylan/chitin deacetylase (PgdA/CDA1 family)